MLADYLSGDPHRLPILQSILGLLDDDGSVGDKARYYVVTSSVRRAVLRGALLALGFKLPSWAKESRAAYESNRQFVAAYRRVRNQRTGPRLVA